MVVVHESDADTAFLAANTYFFRYVLKFAFGLIAKQVDTIGEANREIGASVVVEISRGATQAAPESLIPDCCVMSSKRPPPRLCRRRLAPSAVALTRNKSGLPSPSKSKKHAPVEGPEAEPGVEAGLAPSFNKASIFCAVKCTAVAGGTASEGLVTSSAREKRPWSP